MNRTILKLFFVFTSTLSEFHYDDLHSDIRLTNCQRKYFQNQNYELDASEDVPCPEWGRQRAQQADVLKWDQQWNPEQEKYNIPYYFTRDFSKNQKKTIRQKLKVYIICV